MIIAFYMVRSRKMDRSSRKLIQNQQFRQEEYVSEIHAILAASRVNDNEDNRCLWKLI